MLEKVGGVKQMRLYTGGMRSKMFKLGLPPSDNTRTHKESGDGHGQWIYENIDLCIVLSQQSDSRIQIVTKL